MGVDADGDQPSIAAAVAADHDQSGRSDLSIEGVSLLVIEEVGSDLVLDDLIRDVGG